MNLYKGILLDLVCSKEHIYKITLNDIVLEGRCDSIRHTINWWNDTKVIIPPEVFTYGNLDKDFHIKKVRLHGFLIENLSGQFEDWQTLYFGIQIKGSLSSIRTHINKFRMRYEAN